MNTNKIYTKDEGQSFKSYWGDVTERVRGIVGPDVRKAYLKVFECNPKDEPYARKLAKEELERYLGKRGNTTFLKCDMATVVVTLKNGHTFSFTNSEWGYLEKVDPPGFE